MSFDLYNATSFKISNLITSNYSTSFGLAIKVFNNKLKDGISAVYGYVRLADEIVDSFHQFDKLSLLREFRHDTFKAISNKISVNPVLHSFQATVNEYEIPLQYITDFLDSMEMDLSNSFYERQHYDEYIYGSAEVVGLMCLKVFCGSDKRLFESLIIPARALGSAFQKVNFLRDIKSDLNERGRIYLPGASQPEMINLKNKELLEREIDKEFSLAFTGIKRLPNSSKLAVYSAYLYYLMLFKKIKRMKVSDLLTKRVRISNLIKLTLLFRSLVKVKLLKIL
ncbi:MAG: phytoene/squalene synthase family protein [Ignavibacteria bacterium]